MWAVRQSDGFIYVFENRPYKYKQAVLGNVEYWWKDRSSLAWYGVKTDLDIAELSVESEPVKITKIDYEKL